MLLPEKLEKDIVQMGGRIEYFQENYGAHREFAEVFYIRPAHVREHFRDELSMRYPEYNFFSTKVFINSNIYPVIKIFKK